MRTIGVLGGIGPQATIDFVARIHEISQRLVPQHLNQGYPPLVTYYLRHAPFLHDASGTPREPLTLDPRVLEAARELGRAADLLVVPSNTPHYFTAEIESAAGATMLSIIDVTVAELRRRRATRVGLLGLGIPKIYAERLEAEGITVAVAAPHQRDDLDGAIFRLMEGRDNGTDQAIALDAVQSLRAHDAGPIVVGCSEIPLLLGSEATAEDLVNPAQLLAEQVVREAIA